LFKQIIVVNIHFKNRRFNTRYQMSNCCCPQVFLLRINFSIFDEMRTITEQCRCKSKTDSKPLGGEK
jgi:hypothetical protein